MTSFWLYRYENWCKCPFKKYRNKQKNLENFFFFFAFCHWWKEQDPDPLVSGTHPWIRIRTNMTRIHNTGPFMVNSYFWLKTERKRSGKSMMSYVLKLEGKGLVMVPYRLKLPYTYLGYIWRNMKEKVKVRVLTGGGEGGWGAWMRA